MQRLKRQLEEQREMSEEDIRGNRGRVAEWEGIIRWKFEKMMRMEENRQKQDKVLVFTSIN